MIEATCAALPPVSSQTQARIRAAPRTAAAHKDLMGSIPALNSVQVGGRATHDALAATLTLAAWNVERCLFPVETAAHLRAIAPDVVLLSEVDHGMSRTGQRHTCAEIAQHMGMAYAFGVEFHELGLGGPTERRFCLDAYNRLGWHGNAILSAAPMTRVALLRLDEDGHWFDARNGAGDPVQLRVGGRMALLAEIPTQAGPLCVVSTHLESNGDALLRDTQFARLLTAVETFAGSAPVLIGGDLNTGNHLPPEFDWRQETLFARARQAGFSWDFSPDVPATTRPSLITPHPGRRMKLDWIAGRGPSCDATGLLSSVSAQDVPLSDHDCVWCRATLRG